MARGRTTMRRFFKVLIASRFRVPLWYSQPKRNSSTPRDGTRSHEPFKNSPIRSFVGLAAVAVVILTSSGCGAPTAPTLGAVLDGLSKDVNNIVSNAATNAESDILAAA